MCLSRVAGANIKKRAQAILSGRVANKLMFAKRAVLAVAGIAVVPIAAGIMNGSIMGAQSQVGIQSDAAAGPKFEVASIRPCLVSPPIPGGRGDLGRDLRTSPGRLNIKCMSVSDLIDVAYVQFGRGRLQNDSTRPFSSRRIRNGPAWVYSDRYTIEAEADGPVVNGPAMEGPMLRVLIEDRFQLKTHREVEEVPMYALTVAKGGPKLKPMDEGGCIQAGHPQQAPSAKPRCGFIGEAKGPNRSLTGGGVRLNELAQPLNEQMITDRHVIDKTGITTTFNIHLEYTPDNNTARFPGPGAEPADPTPDVPLGPTIFTALQEQLGLKLVPDKGPHGFIVIDHVERPSEN